jgi:hypothetical protein
VYEAKQLKRWLSVLTKKNRKYEDLLKQVIMATGIRKDQLVEHILEM